LSFKDFKDLPPTAHRAVKAILLPKIAGFACKIRSELDQVLPMDSIDQAIEATNQGFERVQILRRGRKLSLRGSLPKKPGKGRGNAQQTIALGIFANPDGVKIARSKAQKLESDLGSAF
jgi:hypothetical protein